MLRFVNSSRKLNKLLFLLTLTLFSFHLSAENLINKQAHETISKLYHNLDNNLTTNMAQRLDKISAYFLDTPYILGALGEGESALFDQFPAYRTDGFDCETYVTTVLALALANNFTDFTFCLNRIRYHKAQVDYLARNHFTGLDWNLNNQQQGFIKDITYSIKDRDNQPIAQLATALIDKPAWYQHKTTEAIRLTTINSQEQAKRLIVLKKIGSKLPRRYERVPYLPLNKLFDQQGNPQVQLFKQIPHAAIIEIVRPNWNLSKEIGTHLNISHLGFAFWQRGILIFREASSTYSKVVDIPLIDYLNKARLSSTIKGINVQILLPKTPLGYQCNKSK